MYNLLFLGLKAFWTFWYPFPPKILLAPCLKSETHKKDLEGKNRSQIPINTFDRQGSKGIGDHTVVSYQSQEKLQMIQLML